MQTRTPGLKTTLARRGSRRACRGALSDGPKAMIEPALKELYEDPETPLSSGVERAEMQAAMLAAAAASSRRPLVAVDVGCGDGTATAVAMARCKLTPGAEVSVIGLDWSCAALALARRRGISVARAAIDGPGLPLASGSVDVVIMSELIEHLVDTDAALDEAATGPRAWRETAVVDAQSGGLVQPGAPRPRYPARVHRGEPARHLRPPGSPGGRPPAHLHPSRSRTAPRVGWIRRDRHHGGALSRRTPPVAPASTGLFAARPGCPRSFSPRPGGRYDRRRPHLGRHRHRGDVGACSPARARSSRRSPCNGCPRSTPGAFGR